MIADNSQMGLKCPRWDFSPQYWLIEGEDLSGTPRGHCKGSSGLHVENPARGAWGGVHRRVIRPSPYISLFNPPNNPLVGGPLAPTSQRREQKMQGSWWLNQVVSMRASLVAHLVKNLPAMQETLV